MKRFLLLLFFLSCLCAGHTQEKLPVFGKPDVAELDMRECEFEKQANAMKLLDIEEKEIIADYGLKVKTEKRVRIKIFNRQGFEAATIKIPYISITRGSKVVDLDAYIYYKDSLGKIITEKVDKEQIFKDKGSNQYTYLKFTFPNLRPGCVIEYRYEKKEKDVLDLKPWYFQDYIPTKYSAFTLYTPTAMKITWRLFGMDSVLVNSVYEKGLVDGKTYYRKTFLHQNISSFKPEPLMTSVADNLIRIEFTTEPVSLGVLNVLASQNRWKIYASILNQVPQFGKQFNTPIPGTEGIIDTAGKITSREEKINYIFQQVKKQFIWNKSQTFYSGDIKEAWAEKTGNSADMNLILLNLLRRSGINCYPLMISTRDHGKTDPDFLSLSQFNGVDVLLLDSTSNYVLDGTTKYQSYKIPPQNILNRNAFNADTAYANWVFITDTRPLLKTILTITSSLAENGRLEGAALTSFYDYTKSLRLSDNKKKEDHEQEEEEKEFLKKDFTDLKIDSLVIQGDDNDLLPLTETFNFSYQPSVSDEFVFIDPFFLSNFRKNPFADSARSYSIDFTSKQYLKTALLITIPDNYEIDFIPGNTRLRMADSSIMFERIIHKSDDKIYFVNKMEIFYPIFDKEEYPDIREFFNKMYAMLTEQIILKKKK